MTKPSSLKYLAAAIMLIACIIGAIIGIGIFDRPRIDELERLAEQRTREIDTLHAEIGKLRETIKELEGM